MTFSTHWHTSALTLLVLAPLPAAAWSDAGVGPCGRVTFEPTDVRDVPANFEGVLVRRADPLTAAEVELEQRELDAITPVPFMLEERAPGEWRVRPDGPLVAGLELRVIVASCSGASADDRTLLSLRVTPEAPLPADLGTIESDPVARLHTGEAWLALHYFASAAAAPWAGAWWGAIEVDGERVSTPGPLGDFLESDGHYVTHLAVACSPGASGIAPGEHTLRVVGGPLGGDVGGTSNEIVTQIGCPPIPPPPDTSGCIDAGVDPDGVHHSSCPADAGPPRTCPGWPDGGNEPPIDEEGNPICGDDEGDDEGAGGATCSASPGRGAPIVLALVVSAGLALTRRRRRAP